MTLSPYGKSELRKTLTLITYFNSNNIVLHIKNFHQKMLYYPDPVFMIFQFWIEKCYYDFYYGQSSDRGFLLTLHGTIRSKILNLFWTFPGWGPRSKWSMKIPIQTIFAYENIQADQKCLWSRLCLVQNFGAFMCSFKNAYEKTCTDKNAICYRLWLVPFMKRLRKTEKVYDPDFGSFNLWKDWS